MTPVIAALIPLLVLVTTVAVVAIRARRKTTHRRPVREPSAYVILEENLWDACTVDDVREPWTRLATEPVRGFCGVSPGRHRVRTKTSEGDATLDFVVYPGEVLAWRLDVGHARWAPHDLDGDTRSLLEGAPTSAVDVALSGRPKLPGWLVHLRTTIGMAANRSGASLARANEDSVDRVKRRLVKLVARAEADEDDDDVVGVARALGEALVGKPMTRKEIRGLVAPVRDAAQRLVVRGDHGRAIRILSLGLGVLPGDPELMVVAGCTHAARGDVDEAVRALEAALERDRCLEAEDVARAMRARMDLRSRLGLRVRV